MYIDFYYTVYFILGFFIFVFGCFALDTGEAGGKTTGFSIFFALLFFFLLPLGLREEVEITTKDYVTEVTKDNIPFIVVEGNFKNLSELIERNVEEGQIVVKTTKVQKYKNDLLIGLQNVSYSIVVEAKEKE